MEAIEGNKLTVTRLQGML
jgi:chromosome segregation ATPase